MENDEIHEELQKEEIISSNAVSENVEKQADEILHPTGINYHSPFPICEEDHPLQEQNIMHLDEDIVPIRGELTDEAKNNTKIFITEHEKRKDAPDVIAEPNNNCRTLKKIKQKPKIPKIDNFAKKKINNKRKIENEVEQEIIKSCKSMSNFQESANEVLQLQKLDLQERLQRRHLRPDHILPVQEVECSDGFLNIIRTNWNKLDEKEQEDMFLDVLNVIEEYERMS